MRLHDLGSIAVISILAVLGCTKPEDPPQAVATENAGAESARGEREATEPPTQPPAQPPASVGRPGDAIAVTRGCALRRNGTVACWGNNEFGQLGQGHFDPLEGAVEVQGLRDAIAVEVGSINVCAVRRAGSVVCWGHAQGGMLGSGNELAHPGLVEVQQVAGATQIDAGDREFCAKTSKGTWCWGTIYDLVPDSPELVDSLHPLDFGPQRLPREDLASMRLRGSRSFARLEDGRVGVWDPSKPFEHLADVVDVFSPYKSYDNPECLLRTGGEVACKFGSSDSTQILTSLHGASSLSFGSNYGDVIGLLPDGSLVMVAADASEHVLGDARNIAALALEGGKIILAATRDGRVLEWSLTKSPGKFPPREVVLPDLDQGPRVATLGTGRIPSWCSIEMQVVSPTEIDSTAVDRYCAGLNIASDSPSCPKDGPWLNYDWSYMVSLVVPLGSDRFGQIAEFTPHHYGTEEALWIERVLVRSSNPVDLWVRLRQDNRDCFDDGEGGETCGMGTFGNVQLVVTGLAGGDLLRTEILVEAENLPRGMEIDEVSKRFPAARVEVTSAGVEVWACGGHAKLPLPALENPGEAADTDALPTEPAPVVVPVSADEAAAGAKRCNSGWSLFSAGDLAGATLEIDAALAVLERAADERGRRSLGACLYNRGRIAEQAGEVASARDFYQRSLAARPNDTVAARLATLGSP